MGNEKYKKKQNDFDSGRVETSEKSSPGDVGLLKAIRIITDRGNNAEVRKRKDGSLTVYEVKKSIVTEYAESK